MPQSPYIREAGSGTSVVCLHCNASSSSQWRGLMDALSPSHHVIAPDLYGAGASPAWPMDRAMRLDDDVGLIEPALQRAGSEFALVGHSYGAALALVTALRQPQRVRALALYEPTLFSLIEAVSPAPNDADGIRNTVIQASKAVEAGAPSEAARYFIDYWMGAGAWSKTPEQRRGPIEASMVNVKHWGAALMNEPTPIEAFAKLDIPVLLMTGTESPASSLGVARLLVNALPQVQAVEFEGLGHMGPVTHPGVVNEAIVRFLQRH